MNDLIYHILIVYNLISTMFIRYTTLYLHNIYTLHNYANYVPLLRHDYVHYKKMHWSK